jgi:hypothetical protein
VVLSPEQIEQAKKKLDEVVDEVHAARKSVFDKFDAAASDAADLVIEEMKSQPKDDFELEVKKFRQSNAKHVLKLAGYDVERHELRAREGFKIVVVDYGNDRDKDPSPA